MPTQPKIDSPEFYWLDVGAEVIALVPDDTDAQIFFSNYLAHRTDLELLTVADFCVTAPDDYVEPDAAAFMDGSAVEAYRNLAKMSVFYNLCEDA